MKFFMRARYGALAFLLTALVGLAAQAAVVDKTTSPWWGTPAVALKISPGPQTGELVTEQQWFTERYHAQADDLGQPVGLGAADAFNRLIYQLALRVADGPAKLRWHSDSFFAKFATESAVE
jgi:hypothetical protein